MTFPTRVPKQEYICVKGTCVGTKSLLQTAPIETRDTIEKAWACYSLSFLSSAEEPAPGTQNERTTRLCRQSCTKQDDFPCPKHYWD